MKRSLVDSSGSLAGSGLAGAAATGDFTTEVAAAGVVAVVAVVVVALPAVDAVPAVDNVAVAVRAGVAPDAVAGTEIAEVEASEADAVIGAAPESDTPSGAVRRSSPSAPPLPHAATTLSTAEMHKIQ